jgi:hypothetical protein
MSTELTAEKLQAMGRELAEAKWELPERYRLTPEMLAKSDTEQTRLSAAAAMPYGGMSPQEVERARSWTIIGSLRDTLSELERSIGEALVEGRHDLEELQSSRVAVRHQLAERCAIVGRYDLAAEIEPDPVYRDEYLEILKAIWRDDDEWCNCGPLRGSGEHAHIAVSQQVVKAEVWSLRHDQVMMLLKCNCCGFLNVTSMPEHLRRQRELRARARQVVSDMAPMDAAEELKRLGHTTRQLLK